MMHKFTDGFKFIKIDRRYWPNDWTNNLDIDGNSNFYLLTTKSYIVSSYSYGFRPPDDIINYNNEVLLNDAQKE